MYISRKALRHLLRSIQMLLCAVMCSVLYYSCEKVDYIEPFRWGRATTLFNIKGNPTSVTDSMYSVEYLAITNTFIYHKENKTRLFSLTLDQDGYPLSIFRGDLGGNISIDISITPSTRVFEKVKVYETSSFSSDTFAGIVQFPTAKSYLIKSNSRKQSIINVLQEEFYDDFTTKKLSSWSPTTGIETRREYSVVNDIGRTQTVQLFSDNNLFSTSTLIFDQSGFTIKKTIVTEGLSGQQVYTYVYSDIDLQGNWHKVEVSNNNILESIIERTILY